jgi:hypothetical protein
MARIKQNSNSKGSLKDIQLLVNKHSTILNNAIIQKNKILANVEFEWLSPLEKDDFAEYSDESIIKLLNLKLTTPIFNFWPNGGAHWDALGQSKDGILFLVEAKANIPEIVTDPSGATSPTSIALIQKSLLETKTFLKIKNGIDWSGKFYQYTNRLAHLYFLRVINGVDAYLVNIYFLNDKAVKGPKTKEEWEAAIQVMKTYLGVGKHKLSKYMIDVFIDVNEMIK